MGKCTGPRRSLAIPFLRYFELIESIPCPNAPAADTPLRERLDFALGVEPSSTSESIRPPRSPRRLRLDRTVPRARSWSSGPGPRAPSCPAKIPVSFRGWSWRTGTASSAGSAGVGWATSIGRTTSSSASRSHSSSSPRRSRAIRSGCADSSPRCASRARSPTQTSAGCTTWSKKGLLRFGLVSVIGYFFVSSVLSSFPITTHLSSWYAPTGLFAILLVLAAAEYAFLSTGDPGAGVRRRLSFSGHRGVSSWADSRRRCTQSSRCPDLTRKARERPVHPKT